MKLPAIKNKEAIHFQQKYLFSYFLVEQIILLFNPLRTVLFSCFSFFIPKSHHFIIGYNVVGNPKKSLWGVMGKKHNCAMFWGICCYGVHHAVYKTCQLYPAGQQIFFSLSCHGGIDLVAERGTVPLSKNLDVVVTQTVVSTRP